MRNDIDTMGYDTVTSVGMGIIGLLDGLDQVFTCCMILFIGIGITILGLLGTVIYLLMR